MNAVTLFNSHIPQGREYCSQNTNPPSLFQTIERQLEQTIERQLERIQYIAAQAILCRHDIQEINHAYGTIDRLEKRMDRIPEPNSYHALELVIEKIKAICQKETITAQNLIWLYHVQRFSQKELRIDELFETASQKFKKTPESMIEMAEHLPCCISEDQFNQDVAKLIGSNPDEKVQKILHRKKKKLQEHVQLEKEIAKRKGGLEILRKNNPQNYPPYLDELLDEGAIYLYDHLLQMRSLGSRNERRAKAEEISFSVLSHIVLETRNAIIQKIERSIPKDRSNILFLLGGTGAGKSTTLCFLRGDSMTLQRFDYVSQNDTQQLIGLAEAASCTFLPSIEMVNDLVIIDFPGFSDTNGPFISLGMEFALKALIAKHQPKILVVEAITNTENRFEAAAQLGTRLSRLLENKKDCLLGITKYSKDPNFREIQTIEKQQKEDLLRPSDEENEIIIDIKFYSKKLENTKQSEDKKKIKKFQDKIEALQQKLEALRLEKAPQQQVPLPDTPEKKASREALERRETVLSTQIGIENILRLDNLEDPQCLSFCLERLSKLSDQNIIHARFEQILDSEDERLLWQRFETSLKLELEENGDYDIEFSDFKAFEQSVLESSLVNTVLSLKNPEIGQFLHLPENNPNLVREFDKRVVENCIKNYMNYVINELNISFINKVIEETKIKVPKDRLVKLNQKLERLRNYVMGLLGVFPEDLEKAEEKWNHIQREHRAAAINLEESFKLPNWAMVCLCLPAGIPYGLHKLYRWNAQNKAEQNALEKIVNDCCMEMDRIHDTLVRLKDIEKIIQKQEDIDTAFRSIQLSLESGNDLWQSMQDKIGEIKKIYVVEDWDKRVQILKDKSHEIYNLTDFEAFCLAVSLVDENIKYAIEERSATVVEVAVEKGAKAYLGAVAALQIVGSSSLVLSPAGMVGAVAAVKVAETAMRAGASGTAVTAVAAGATIVALAVGLVPAGTAAAATAAVILDKIIERRRKSEMVSEGALAEALEKCVCSKSGLLYLSEKFFLFNKKIEINKSFKNCFESNKIKSFVDFLEIDISKPLFRMMLGDVLLSYIIRGT